MSNYVKSLITPMYLHKAQNRRACHIWDDPNMHLAPKCIRPKALEVWPFNTPKVSK